MFPQPNWIRVLHEKTSKTQDLALLSNAFAELDIWNGIKYKFQAGFDLGAKNYRDFYTFDSRWSHVYCSPSESKRTI